jgi:hypothetical protein
VTLALTILAHMLDSELATVHALQHLRLDRKPFSRLDRRELAFFVELAPILRRFPGDRVQILRACPERCRPGLEAALTLSDDWMQSAGDFSALVARWSCYGGAGWRPPTANDSDAQRAAQTPEPPPLPWGALAKWHRNISEGPPGRWHYADPLCQLAHVEHLAAVNRRWGDVEGVRACWESFQRIVAASVDDDMAAA